MNPGVAHFNTAFGLNLRSCVALPGPAPLATAAAPEVEVGWGEVPDELPAASVRGARYQIAPGQFLFWVDGIARFLVSEGQRIVVQRAPGADDDDVRAFLVTSALGALLHQRGDLVLHASGIVTRDGGVVFLGASGVGKSTLAAALHRRGHAVLTDELCVVRRDAAGGGRIHPGFPALKLWPDALALLDLPAAGLRPVRRGIEKRVVPIAGGFATAAVPVRKVYLLTTTRRGEAVRLTQPEATRRLNLLHQHTYFPQIAVGLSGKAAHFQRVLELAQHLAITVVERPDRGADLAGLVRRVEEDLVA